MLKKHNLIDQFSPLGLDAVPLLTPRCSLMYILPSLWTLPFFHQFLKRVCFDAICTSSLCHFAVISFHFEANPKSAIPLLASWGSLLKTLQQWQGWSCKSYFLPTLILTSIFFFFFFAFPNFAGSAVTQLWLAHLQHRVVLEAKALF